jgi:hypothetical protein
VESASAHAVTDEYGCVQIMPSVFESHVPVHVFVKCMNVRMCFLPKFRFVAGEPAYELYTS